MKFLTGDDTGILKVVKVEAQKVARLGPQRIGDAIEKLCWTGPAEDREARVAVAYASGLLESRDASTGSVLSSARAAPSVKCLHVLGSGLLSVSADGRCGIVRDWCGDSCPEGGESGADGAIFAGAPNVAVANTDQGNDLSEEGPWLKRFSLQGPIADACIDPCKSERLAFGGEENDVKIFDVERGELSWRAKNVRENFLCLRVPVRINSLSWATELAPSRSLLLSGSSDGKIRLYDVSAQRRPLFELLIGHGTGQGSAGYTGTADELARPVTCSAVARVSTRNSGNAWSFFVADTVGSLREYDLRHLPTCKPAEIPPGRKKHLAWAAKQMPFRRGYKGVMGSVRAVGVHASGEIVVATGLGRFAYIFETRKRSRASMVGKVYLKQKLCSVLFSSEDRAPTAEAEGNDDESGAAGEAGAASDVEGPENDEVQEGFSSDEEARGGDDEATCESTRPKLRAKVGRKKKRSQISSDTGLEQASGTTDVAIPVEKTSAGPRRKKRRASAK